MFNVKMIMLVLLGLLLAFVCFDKDDIYRRKYLEVYKKEIISHFIKSINARLRYSFLDLDKEQIKKYYEYAEFDNTKFDDFLAADYIEGFINDDVFVKISDLNITKTTYSRKLPSSRWKFRKTTIFNGLFVHTTNNKKDIDTFIEDTTSQVETSIQRQ